MKTLGVIIVSYGHEAEIPQLVDSFLPQLSPGDQVVIVDNKQPWRFDPHTLPADARIRVLTHNNGGFAAGCNFGAQYVDTDLLFFLNPDTIIKDPTLFDTLRRAGESDYAAFMPYLLLFDGTVNSAGNALHISGLSWVHGLGTRPEAGEITDIAIASGACLVVQRDWWDKLSGMFEEYFMYHEDTDFSARVLLAGGKVGLVHAGKVHHNYDFDKGDYKWIYIERNRVLFPIITWPMKVLMALLPQLIAIELALWAVALKQGRAKMKLESVRLTITALPRALRLRHQTQQLKVVSSSEFFRHMSWQLDNPNVGLPTVVGICFRLYYQLAGAFIQLLARSK